MIKEFTYRNHLVRVYHDECDDNPCEWDNLGIIVSFHRRVNFTTKSAPRINANNFSSLNEIQKHLIKEHGAVVILKVYMLDHSGISLSTVPFNDPFDSGTLGFIYTTRERILSSYAKKRLSKSLRDQVTRDLAGEIDTLNQYTSGEVYAYVVDPESETDYAGKHDLVGGNYYDMDQLEEAAKSDIDSLTAHDDEQDFIKNLPAEELPKYVNHAWKFPRSSMDTFKNRLKGVSDGTNS